MEKIIDYMKNNAVDYKNFIIIYDIISYNFNQLEADLIRGKINKKDIDYSYNLLKNIDKNIIDDYMIYRVSYISN